MTTTRYRGFKIAQAPYYDGTESVTSAAMCWATFLSPPRR